MDQLDLQLSEYSKIYRAPFQVKASGGVLIVDDFGRQRMSPAELLNRWIVPLEKGFDSLTLDTGVKFPVPFDCILIFATNLNPRYLVDEAFLRRIQFKVEVESPDRKGLEKIFRMNCEETGMDYRPEAVDFLFRRFYDAYNIRPRGCHPQGHPAPHSVYRQLRGQVSGIGARPRAPSRPLLLPRDGGGDPSWNHLHLVPALRGIMTDTPAGPSDMARMRDMEEDRFRHRLLALEREADSLRSRARILTVGLAVALILAAVGFLGYGPGGGNGSSVDLEVLRAERIVLLDPSGSPRGEWTVDGEGNARLALLDHQGRPRLSLSVLSGGFPGLSLINANGARRAAFGLLPDESTSLVFADAAGVPRAVLGLSRADAAHLVFADAEGVSRVALGLEGSGQGSVILPEDMQAADTSGGGR